jgi:hypothetical protein
VSFLGCDPEGLSLAVFEDFTDWSQADFRGGQDAAILLPGMWPDTL